MFIIMETTGDKIIREQREEIRLLREALESVQNNSRSKQQVIKTITARLRIGKMPNLHRLTADDLLKIEKAIIKS